MNQLDSALQTPELIDVAPTSVPYVDSPHRLAVVILEAEEEALLASRILELARPLDLPILLIGIAPDPADERKVRRNLVTIAAFIREGDARSEWRQERHARTIAIDIQIVPGREWLGKLKSLLRRDDMLACYSEQVVGSQHRPLTDILAGDTNAPIYSFSGLPTAKKSRQNLLSQAGPWLASLAAIAGCFVVQVRIVSAVQGWAQSLLLLVTLVVDVGVIWLLNSLFVQS
jgi:hypothetical protein